jgi:hypothetical protein
MTTQAGLRLPGLSKNPETNDGIMTSRIVMACRTTANVMTYPCPANLFPLANLKRPMNKMTKMVISNSKAASEVAGALVPKKPVIQ